MRAMLKFGLIAGYFVASFATSLISNLRTISGKIQVKLNNDKKKTISLSFKNVKFFLFSEVLSIKAPTLLSRKLKYSFLDMSVSRNEKQFHRRHIRKQKPNLSLCLWMIKKEEKTWKEKKKKKKIITTSFRKPFPLQKTSTCSNC